VASVFRHAMQTPQQLDHDADEGSFDMWLGHANMTKEVRS
jgi:hypothetical protein